MTKRPHILVVVARGEAVRNFLYSDVLKELHDQAQVTLLTAIDSDEYLVHFQNNIDRRYPLVPYRENPFVTSFRYLIHEAHFRWMWSKVAQNVWEIRDDLAKSPYRKIKRALWKSIVYSLANRRLLERLTKWEQKLSIRFCPKNHYRNLLSELKPDLVFNTQHVHGPIGDMPIRIAHSMGIPTAGFIFSWDNLTSRSRIFVPYDDYFVWNLSMKNNLLKLYPFLTPDRIHVTGTPQFDYHFKKQFILSREELCKRVGADSSRPYIFYTTGVDRHFPEEHKMVQFVIETLNEIDIQPKPQLIVRTYAKGTSDEMKALSENKMKDVIFLPNLWETKTFTPAYEDLTLYTSLLRHAGLGINAASTVSLELLMFGKPVINLGFDPPGSQLSHCLRYERHIEFDHYHPVAESGAVMVARSKKDMKDFISQALRKPEASQQSGRDFIKETYDGLLDGHAGHRIAEKLIALTGESR